MADGFIARKTKSAGKFGAGLDTAADGVFVAVCFVKILPQMKLPAWLWVWVVIIAIVKFFNLIGGEVANKRLISMHTVLNKITGFLLFLLPLTLSLFNPIYTSAAVSFTATLSVIDEVYNTRIGKEIFNIFCKVRFVGLCMC